VRDNVASGPDVWCFKATAVGKANLKVQIKVEAEGNPTGTIEHRSGS
jgi:hypothetical protein